VGTTASGATIAVIGAGMAGAACARALADAGHDVRVFDKGRSVGGRLAQRRVEHGVFDHGAQYLGAREPRFVARAEAWEAAGSVAPWPGVTSGEGHPVLVGVPAMNAPVKALLAGLPVITGSRITALRHGEGGWTLGERDDTRHGPFAAVALAVPAPQAAALLGGLEQPRAAALLVRLGGVAMAPCWTALAAFAAPPGLDEPARRFADGAVAWVARNATKPGRPKGESWTVHAGPGWSAERLEREPGEVAPALLAALARQLGRDLPEPVWLAAHRWRHALVTAALGEPCLWDPALRLGLCGDWCLGPRVEAAFLSGLALGEAIAG
jgi:predicted NAD/FAD-dependent oxidoreductase